MTDPTLLSPEGEAQLRHLIETQADASTVQCLLFLLNACHEALPLAQRNLGLAWYQLLQTLLEASTADLAVLESRLGGGNDH